MIHKALIVALLFCVAASARGALLFFDDFEYTVDGTDCTPFVTQGGWNSYKAINCTGSHRGNLYTSGSIPGYAGSFPGTASSKVLLIEQLPYSTSGGDLNAQTDIYLEYGNPSQPAGHLPANVWFQWWMYINRYGDELSEKLEGKFLYPSQSGNYPANPAWLFGSQKYSYQRFRTTSTIDGAFFFSNHPPGADDQTAEEWNQWKLGGNEGVASDGELLPNTWYQIKLHIDTSGTSPLAAVGQGVYEMWVRPSGGAWTKTAEWIGGVTSSFVWTPLDTLGNRALRMPTTVAGGDEWLYLDDFAIATEEADLPTYDDDTTPPTVTSRTIPSAGTTFVLGLDEAVTVAGAVPTLTGCSGGATTLSSPSGSGTSTITYTLSRQVLGAETGCVNSYTQPGNGIEDLAGNDLASFSAQAVTNSSTQTLVALSGLTPAAGTRLRRTVAQTTIGVSTNKAATCRWGRSPGMSWANLTAYTTTGSTSHSSAFPVTPGTVYQICARCLDTAAAQYSADACAAWDVRPERRLH